MSRPQSSGPRPQSCIRPQAYDSPGAWGPTTGAFRLHRSATRRRIRAELYLALASAANERSRLGFVGLSRQASGLRAVIVLRPDTALGPEALALGPSLDFAADLLLGRFGQGQQLFQTAPEESEVTEIMRVGLAPGAHLMQVVECFFHGDDDGVAVGKRLHLLLALV